MVVGADVEPGIILGPVDPQRGRLCAALVAARSGARLHRRHQAFGKGQVHVGLIGRQSVGDDSRAGQHVARDRDPVADQMPGPVDALAPRYGPPIALGCRSCGSGAANGPRRARSYPPGPLRRLRRSASRSAPSSPQHRIDKGLCRDSAALPPRTCGTSAPTAKNRLATATP